jgi:hypothetical protein
MFCCGDYSYFGGYSYCHGTTDIGGSCWFDEQCEREGYCDETCQPAKNISDVCSGQDECGTKAFCGRNSTGTFVCQLKQAYPKSCSVRYYLGSPQFKGYECISGACGIGGSGDPTCCESGETFLSNNEEHCTATKADQEICLHDKQCISGLCYGEQFVDIFIIVETLFFMRSNIHQKQKENAWARTTQVQIVQKEEEKIYNATLKSVVYEQLVQISISAVLAKVLPNAAYFCLLFLPNTHPFVVLLNDTQIFISN